MRYYDNWKSKLINEAKILIDNKEYILTIGYVDRYIEFESNCIYNGLYIRVWDQYDKYIIGGWLDNLNQVPYNPNYFFVHETPPPELLISIIERYNKLKAFL